jgi:hypothetical protein
VVSQFFHSVTGEMMLFVVILYPGAGTNLLNVLMECSQPYYWWLYLSDDCSTWQQHQSEAGRKPTP